MEKLQYLAWWKNWKTGGFNAISAASAGDIYLSLCTEHLDFEKTSGEQRPGCFSREIKTALHRQEAFRGRFPKQHKIIFQQLWYTVDFQGFTALQVKRWFHIQILFFNFKVKRNGNGILNNWPRCSGRMEIGVLYFWRASIKQARVPRPCDLVGGE